MVKQRTHGRTAALAAAAVALVAVLGGTSYAATRTSHHAAAASHHHSSSLSKSAVKKLVKKYVKKHAADLTGPAGAPGVQGPAGPGAIPFAIGTTSASSATHSLKAFGQWHATVKCSASAVSVAVVGPGIGFGTNTIAAHNGAAGATYETSGPVGGTFGIGVGSQGSATEIVKYKNAAYSVSFFANALGSSPVTCDVIGYAIKL